MLTSDSETLGLVRSIWPKFKFGRHETIPAGLNTESEQGRRNSRNRKPPIPTIQWHTAVVARRLLDSPNTLALELSSAGARPLHTLAPGQYAWLAVSAPDDDPNILRYSLWMAPRLGNSRLTIRLVDGFNSGFAGEASNYLHYHLYDGDSLEVGLPSNAPVCLVDRG